MDALFAGTAEYYDRYRPGLPEAALEYIVHSVPVPVTLLDIGTGTGRVLEQFAPYFSDIVAVEPDSALMKIARERLMSWPVHFVNMSAEDMVIRRDWQASLVTMVRAFHWMKRELVLRKLESIVAPDGVIAVCSDHSFWELGNEWSDAAKSVIQHFLGTERRAANGTYKEPSRPFTQDFLDSPFSDLAKHFIPLTRTWTADEIIGYLYSTSYASKKQLGDRAARFEETLRRELQSLSSKDEFVEHNEVQIILARRAAV